jgi:hypothetical protein
MLADKHRARALGNEQAVTDLGDWVAKPYVRPTVVEGYWGAALHWVAYGCEMRYGRHKEREGGLVSFLRGLGESSVADRWRTVEAIRNEAWNTCDIPESAVQSAHDEWQRIRAWAMSRASD